MTLSDLKWPFHASLTTSAVAELLVYFGVIAWNCLFTPTLCGGGTAWRHLYPNPITDPFYAETYCLSHKAWKSVQPFDLGVVAGPIKMDTTVEKVTKVSLHFTKVEENPPLHRLHRNLRNGRRPRVITYAGFRTEIFKGYDFVVGGDFRFSCRFLNGPYNLQHQCAACDMMYHMTTLLSYDW